NADLFEWIEPMAGPVMLVRIKQPLETHGFTRRLVEEEGVLLIPCTTCFGMREGYLRLGLGSDPEVFDSGLKRTARFLRSNL
ncbi:MAG TPA: hypothetical protein VLQ45_15295, partial [Thermoanaerobaculia bacterium]|nr:hypothetical protein [Thermoanaerobaculia bacterium]